MFKITKAQYLCIKKNKWCLPLGLKIETALADPTLDRATYNWPCENISALDKLIPTLL